MSKSRQSIITATVSVMLLSACASTPDPAKVCTAEWIKPRAERAVDRIAVSTKSAMRPLKKAAKSYAKGDKPGLLTLMSLNSSLKKLERELKSGRGVKDLKTLSSTCDDPKIVSDAVVGFFQEQGLPDAMIDFIQQLPMYEDIIRVAPRQS